MLRKQGSGHMGQKSPHKKDRISTLEFSVAKLRSPMKRSMFELNKIAYENAKQNRKLNLDNEIDDDEELVLNENRILNEIIRLSKVDGTNPLHLEDEEEAQEDLKIQRRKRIEQRIAETDLGTDDEYIPEPKIEADNVREVLTVSDENLEKEISSPSRKRKLSITFRKDDEVLKDDHNEFIEFVEENTEDPPLKKPTISNTAIRINLKTDTTPSLKFESNEIKPSISPVNTPLSTPIKKESNNSAFSSPLRRTPRTRISTQLQAASIESSPRSPRSPRRSTRNLASSFNDFEKLKPKNFQSIKLMEVPDIDTNDDELLETDKNAKNRTLYHDGYEAYFEQSQTRPHISKNSMSSFPELTYEEFNEYNKELDLKMSKLQTNLSRLYEMQFAQWSFELKEGFNLMFYGFGSKRNLLIKFLRDYLLPEEKNAKCLVINGYNPEFSIRSLFRELWKICFNKVSPIRNELREICNLTHLEFMKHKYKSTKLFILINNIDGESFKNEDLQYILSQISKIQQISLLCTADNLNTPVLWDASTLSNFNFIWHHISNYQSYATELTFKDPLSLGKTDEIAGSRGAKYVLNSLTENAKSLYKHLILSQIEKIDNFIGDDVKLVENRGNIKGSMKCSIQLRDFYELCISEFIISNDISFRTILGEFSEHKMCTLSRDSTGVEMIYIGFSIDELEKLLDQELMD